MTLGEAVEAFLRGREASGCTAATLAVYRHNLARFAQASEAQALAEVTPKGVEDYLAALRSRLRPVSVHQHFRTLKAFFRWAATTGWLDRDPMAGLTMRVPKTLPDVPTDEDVRRLLNACTSTSEGLRNRALVALLADSLLRREEARRLRISDLNFGSRTILVRQGKGLRDGVTFFGDATASALRAWLAVHPDPRPQAFLFVTMQGHPLGRHTLRLILNRLSRRAGLDRSISPHDLRHYAATAVWRRTGDLALVQRLLRHTTLTMALRYVEVSQADIAVKFQAASPMDHVWAGKGGAGRVTGKGNPRRLGHAVLVPEHGTPS